MDGLHLIQNTEKPVGILGVRREIGPILQRMDVAKTERTGLARFHSGTLSGRQVVAVEIGVGKVNAAAATQSLVDRYCPCCAIFTGSAGALSPNLRVGDLVIAGAAAIHDTGIHRTTGFTPIGFMTLNDKEDHDCALRMYADAELVTLAQRVAGELDWSPDPSGHTVQVYVGTVVTGDQIVLSAEKKNWLLETFGALIVEMEGAAFAHVASANALPWLLIRSVSDYSDHSLDFAFELWLEYVDAPQSAKARIGRASDRLGYMLRHPQAMRRAKQMDENLAHAAENAARLTEAIVRTL